MANSKYCVRKKNCVTNVIYKMCYIHFSSGRAYIEDKHSSVIKLLNLEIVYWKEYGYSKMSLK